jgi:hypothetical protein
LRRRWSSSLVKRMPISSAACRGVKPALSPERLLSSVRLVRLLILLVLSARSCSRSSDSVSEGAGFQPWASKLQRI